MITFRCSQCGNHLEAEIELAGSQVQCPGCGREVRVPTQSPRGVVGEHNATDNPAASPSRHNEAPRSRGLLARLKRALLRLLLFTVLLALLGGALYWHLWRVNRETLVSQLLSVAKDAEDATEYVGARSLYLRAAEIAPNGSLAPTARAGAERVQAAAQKQAGERATLEREILGLRERRAELDAESGSLEAKKRAVEEKTESLGALRVELEKQLLEARTQLKGTTGQFTELSAAVDGLQSKRKQLASTVSQLEDQSRELHESVKRVQWIATAPEPFLKYHETIFKPAVRQLDLVARRVGVVVKAVDLGLRNEDYVRKLLDQETAPGGTIRESQLILENGRAMLGGAAFSPEASKLIETQQESLEFLVETMLQNVARFQKREIDRATLYAWLKAKPTDLNNVIRVERRVFATAMPDGWPSDELPLLDDWREPATNADVVRILDMMDRKELWESNLEVESLRGDAPVGMNALKPGTVVLSIGKMEVHTEEDLGQAIQSVTNQVIDIVYVPADRWRQGIVAASTLQVSKEDLGNVTWRTSYKRSK